MYVLESIQEFNGKKIGIYRLCNTTSRNIRKAEKEIDYKNIPQFAIFILTNKIAKGKHKLYVNESSFIMKTDENDGTKFSENIEI